MGRYLPTDNGRHIVTVYDDGICGSWIKTIEQAEWLLQSHRRDAWNGGSSDQRSSTLANMYLEWANSLTDALAYAAELRGEVEAKLGRAA